MTVQCLVESELKVLFINHVIIKSNAPLLQMFPPKLWLGLDLWCLSQFSTILSVEEAGVPGENHRLFVSH